MKASPSLPLKGLLVVSAAAAAFESAHVVVAALFGWICVRLCVTILGSVLQRSLKVIDIFYFAFIIMVNASILDKNT
jgi:hypothetical protein